MRYLLPLLISFSIYSCSEHSVKEVKTEVINWQEELLGFGSLKVKGESFNHLFYYFGNISEDLSIRGDTLFLSQSQLRDFLNHYSTVPKSKDSLILKPIFTNLSYPSYRFRLKKKEEIIVLTNLNGNNNGPVELSLRMYSSIRPKDLSLLHLENKKDLDDVFHWDVMDEFYLYYEKSYMRGDDFQSFRNLLIEKKVLNEKEEKILFSYLNLLKAHIHYPLRKIQTGCLPSDYNNVFTLVYKDSLYEYGTYTFPVPINLLMDGLTVDYDPNTQNRSIILDTNNFLISHSYKNLPYARKRSENEKRNVLVDNEIEAFYQSK